MFGKITDIDDVYVTIENLKKEAEANVLNFHVIFEEQNRKIVGEIIGINEEIIKILLVGEIRDNIFTSGVIKKPGFTAIARLIYKNEVELLLGSQDVKHKSNMLFGKSTVYDGYYVTASLNDFFANHFAIIGNTGSGKSCGVARILQNLFYYNDGQSPINSRIVLFDVYGEYNSALAKMDTIPNIKVKKYTTKLEFASDEIIKIPTNFLGVDDLALLLEANDSQQLPIIEKALKLVYIFTSNDPKVVEYKNDIIAKSLMDILASGKSPVQIRDQIVAVLTTYHTDTLSLDTIIAQPGYNRTLKQCLNIDQQGKMNAVHLVIELLETFAKLDIEKIETTPDFAYTLDDLYYAFDFALISEGILSNEKVFEQANVLKTRLHGIINSEKRVYFDVPELMGKEEYVRKFFQDRDGYPTQIVNMNFSFIDERFAKVLTKIFAKLFFNFSTNLKPRATFPIHMILEEAHRYVQADTDLNLLGYNIFDRITKEGRKYGVILGFVTQRPSELSTTALSQCSNFVVFRMFHPEDLKIISSISANVSQETIEKLKTLRPGMAIAFGTGFKIPQLTKLELPDPMPQSTSVVIDEIWYKDPNEEIPQVQEETLEIPKEVKVDSLTGLEIEE